MVVGLGCSVVDFIRGRFVERLFFGVVKIDKGSGNTCKSLQMWKKSDFIFRAYSNRLTKLNKN